MSDARMEFAQRSNQVRCRGWDLRPEPPRQAITLIDVLRVLFRWSTLISLGALALSVFLLVNYS